jgi:PAS domain S-box-containing protein
MFSLDLFSLENMYRLACELRELGTASANSDEAASRIVTHLYESLRASRSGAHACPLVRLFRTVSWSALPDDAKSALRPTLDREPSPDMRWLSLSATRGVIDDWNDPHRSRAHRFLSIAAPEAPPMVTALVAQLGLSAKAPFILRTEDSLCDIFYIEQAPGSPFVPAQADFVLPYGIQSVLGFGGLLFDCEAFAVILFCAVHVARETADLFRLIAPSVGLALVAQSRDPGVVEHRLRTTQELLRHHERIALLHVREQREVTERLARSEDEARGHTRELREALRRLEAHHAVTRALAESESLSDAAPRILGELGPALGCSLGYAWRPRGEQLELIGAWPAPIPTRFPEFSRLTLATIFVRGVGLPGRVWASGAPAWLVDVTDDANFPRARAARKVGLRTGIGFPALFHDEVVCVFEMFSRETRARDDDILRVLALVGNQIGQFVGRARAGEAVKLSEMRKGAILRAALDCVVSMNPAGAITEFNPAAERTFGYRREDVIGKDMAALLIPPSLRNKHRRGLAHYLATGMSRILGRRVEMSALRADGTEFPIELTVAPIEVPEGPMFTAFIRDTTERRQAVEERERAADALRASEYRFRTLTRQAPVGIIAMNREGRCNFVNERWCKMAGMSTEQAMEHGWHDALHPEDRQSVLAGFYDAATTGSEFAGQYRLRTRQGTVIWVQGEALPLRSSKGELTGYLGTVTDITDRIQGERVAHFLADATSALNASLDHEAALDAVAKLAVPTIADCCTIHVIEDGLIRLVAITHVDPNTTALAHAVAQWSDRDPGAAIDLARNIRTMGPELIAEVTEDLLPQVALSPAHAAVWRAMIVRSYIAVPLIAHGHPLGVIHLMMGDRGRAFCQADVPFVQDLARRVAFAVENARLYRAAQEAVAAREQFLSIASHELSTPVTALQLAVQHLQASPMTGPVEPLLRPVLPRVERATKRLISLTEDLLDVTRGRVSRLRLDLEDVDLSKLTDEVIAALHDDIKSSGSKVSTRASGSTIGHWDRRKLRRVVTNLLSNALKFGSKHPILVVLDGGLEDRVQMCVRDRGVGIPLEDQARIFERFQRAVSDRHYGGFGLGLWIVRQVVEAHGGTVRVVSELGAGATFTVELPRSGPPASGLGE